MIDGVLRIKTLIPTLPKDYVPRKRLTDLLTKGLEGSVTFIGAQLGYGKTCLASEWYATQQELLVPLAWLTLDADDNNPKVFLDNLQAALAGIGVGSYMNSQNEEINHPDIRLQLSILLGDAESFGKDFILCLDNYEAITNIKIHNIMCFILEHQPPKMHQLIISRAEPPLLFPLLKERGRLLEINESDLCFTRQEIIYILKSLPESELSEKDITDLVEFTEGWPAAVKIEALARFKGTDNTGAYQESNFNDNSGIDRLFDVFINSQSANQLHFMLATSVLDRICAPLCTALLEVWPLMAIEEETPSAAEQLEALQLQHCFIVPLDSIGHWFRYHSLFRDYLRGRLKLLAPEALPKLHRAASEWYMQRSNQKRLLTEAVRHLFLADDWNQAAKLVEEHGLEMVLSGDWNTVSEWTDWFPQEVMEARPLLRLIYIWALRLGQTSGERLLFKDYLSSAERLVSLDYSTEQNNLASLYISMGLLMDTIPDPTYDAQKMLPTAKTILGQFSEDYLPYSNLVLSLAFGHAACHDAADAITHLHDGRRVAQTNGAVIDVVAAGYYEIRIALSQGQLQRAIRLCRQEQGRYKALHAQSKLASPATGWLDIVYGHTLLEMNHLQEAEVVLLRGVDKSAQCEVAHFHIEALTELYRLRCAQGQYEEALDCLNQMQSTWPDYGFLAEAQRLKLLLIRDGGPAVQEHVSLASRAFSPFVHSRKPHLPGMGPLGGSSAYYQAYLAWARIQTLTGRPGHALDYIREHLELVRAKGLTGREVELLVEQSLALDALGQNKGAAESLRLALNMAMPEGYIRIFDGGSALDRLLIKAASNRELREYVGFILGSFIREEFNNKVLPDTEQSGQILQRQTATVGNVTIDLTQREQELLQLVVRGLSNKGIAHTLHIQVGTVKTHLSNIMRKFDVTNRTQLATLAKRYGMDTSKESDF